MDGDMETPPTMGTATAINFQPTGDGRAAITGDFVLVANEVDPVLRVLRTNGIEVTALHNHMLNDEPRLFFMHFWANDDAAKLARGLRAALDRMNNQRSRSEEHTSELQSLMRISYAVFCLKHKKSKSIKINANKQTN